MQFLNEPQSPAARELMREHDGSGKEPIQDLDKILTQNHGPIDLDDDDLDGKILSLEELSKSKSRMLRDEEELKEELEEERALAE